MATLNYLSKEKTGPHGKPRVYFTCHPSDFEGSFTKICNDIFRTHDCTIYYPDNLNLGANDPDHDIDLGSMNLFVIPVTNTLLSTPNRAMDEDFPFAKKMHIPILPILLENGLDELYSRPDRFGELQYLNPNSTDTTEIAYADKLKRYLESVLISDEMAARVRAAFDAYIFLSYRKKDRRYANELMRIIHSSPACRDIAIWFDEFLTPGESFKENIDQILSDSKLFTLLVTPHLLEEPDGKPNFVMGKEYPAAHDTGMEIVPAEMVYTDNSLLRKKFPDIPDCLDIHDESSRARLLDTISRYAKKENNLDQRHNFLIGLAYLSGIDVEVNRERALELITGAAKADLPEAMVRLISMYTDGDGVSPDQNEMLNWSMRLAEHYFVRIFDEHGKLSNTDNLCELFSHYRNTYWSAVIRFFLLKADECVDIDTIHRLYAQIITYEICEYTLLFDTCQEMTQHKNSVQTLLVRDILTKSANHTYPPYGPLFWYVPEYELYETALFALEKMVGEVHFAKALALVRDVCFLFGQKNSTDFVAGKVDGKSLYYAAHTDLSGVRKALCELFYLGSTDAEDGDDLYPRWFNVREAKSLALTGYGIFGRTERPFSDELNLYTHEMYSELDGEYIGLVSCPYDRHSTAKKLCEKPCVKLHGLMLSPTEDTFLDYIAFNRTAVSVFCIPENTTAVSEDFRLHMPLEQGVAWSKDGIVYFRDKVSLSHIDTIPAHMFQNCSMLTEVILSDEVREIGLKAFLNCTKLARIHLPATLSKIGPAAFDGCEQLTELTLPENLKKIEECTFYGCKNITDLPLPDGLTEIDNGAFFACSQLKTEIPAQVTKIGNAAFCGCSALDVLIIPYGITHIPAYAFSGCDGLTRISLPETLTRIEDHAFDWCENLTEIHLPDNVTYIGEWAFYYCSRLEKVTLSKQLTSIGANAFFLCQSLTELYIPDTVMEIGHRCFYQNRLKKVTLPGRFSNQLVEIRLIGDTEVEFYGEFPPNPEDPFACLAPSEEEETDTPIKIAEKTVTVPEGVTTIKDKEYSCDATLTEVCLPDSVTRIGEAAFEQCSQLKKVHLSEGLTEIGPDAFDFCFNLSDVSIPSTVSRIGHGAFRACGISSLTLNAQMTQIDPLSFYCCRNLREVVITCNVTQIGRAAFSMCEKLESITLPEGLVEIGKSAFDRCDSLTSITLPDSVVKIGEEAFCKCKNLTSITFPESVTTIDYSAFACCQSLTEIEIPATVRHIGDDAFACCENLKRVWISSNFKDDINRIFSDCELESVQFI